MADEKRTDAGRPIGAHGPVRDEIIEQQDHPRNDLSEQDSHPTNASDSSLADRTGTGTARRSEGTSDRAPDPDHLGAAERAFEESRGLERRRENWSREDENAGGGGGSTR